ncbi:MAG: DUF72 domain-containing protein [Nitrospirae bacterium]|nr:DUF72 domain-containing protein [Nitrospirota bacterium]
MPDIFIGCSGFHYGHWEGNFYPKGLPKSKWLEFYSKNFSTVELNVTFYRLPTANTFLDWYKKTPHPFTFSVKGSRFITHIKRLIEPSEPLRAFMERAMALKEKLGVILWQFPSTFKADIERLKKFLTDLRHYGLRNAFEFRNETWINREVISLFEKEGVSLCMADWPPFLKELPITADFLYIRRHGEGGSYATCYSDDELKKDALRIKKYLKQSKDVFIYFNNDAFGYAPKNALRLRELIK